MSSAIRNFITFLQIVSVAIGVVSCAIYGAISPSNSQYSFWLAYGFLVVCIAIFSFILAYYPHDKFGNIAVFVVLAVGSSLFVSNFVSHQTDNVIYGIFAGLWSISLIPVWSTLFFFLSKVVIKTLRALI